MAENPLRKLPSVHQVLEALAAREPSRPHEHLVAAIRQELDALRQCALQGTALDGEATADAVALRAQARLQREAQARLRAVINATGIVLHTNLGRAPMAEAAARAAHAAASGYLNLELDLGTGKRSSRQDAIRQVLVRLTGAESATAVNNNAAATVIALRALCHGREVVVSRGQLIEIGGSFRIPDIMAVSGAILREVGTTNITRLADFERAIGPNTGALLQVHTSNYRVSGFTKSVALTDLVTLGHKHQLKVIDDVGSGALLDFARFGFENEPAVPQSVAAGADLVLFSGDKLLGGPQAGLLVGKKKWIQQIERDPLMRAFRLDKMTLAALESTLRLYLDEREALETIPILRMLNVPLADLRRKAETLADQLRTLGGLAGIRVKEDRAYVGGGSLPDQAMKTWVVEIQPAALTEEELARRLRLGDPAVLGRLRAGRVVLDVRTVFPGQDVQIVQAFLQALGGNGS